LNVRCAIARRIRVCDIRGDLGLSRAGMYGTRLRELKDL
jgi:hypothetical protein